MSLRTIFAPLFRALSCGTGFQPVLQGQWPDLPPHVIDEILTSGSLQPHFHYRHFTKPKKDGGRRDLVEPDDRLKRLQHAILRRYFRTDEAHPAAVAYRKHRSIADHVWPHAGAEVLVTADVADFFPSTTEGRVEDWWRERVDAGPARLLTLLTTYRGSLPQGAPTGPALSNALNHELDERLTRRATAAGAWYTRYCDDMVFSWRHGLGPPSDFEQGVRGVLAGFGYALHPVKGWRVHQRRDEPEITGVILTRRGGVRLPDRLIRAMDDLERSDDPHDVARLGGYLGYEAMLRKRPQR